MTDPTIHPAVRAEVERRLAACEAEHDVRILFCVESGSRAWGFPSPDSDYDVRFVYVHPEDWYLAFDVERRRDVIEYPIVDEIDINGWDLRKALYLFTRSNGALFEWLASPICYRDPFAARDALLALAERFLHRAALCYHYSHMARGNANQLLTGSQVKLKKYFYVLRPLLAIRWLLKRGTLPPVPFRTLLDAEAPAELLPSVTALLEAKAKTPELGEGNRLPLVDGFIERELKSHHDAFTGQGRPVMDAEEGRVLLNQLFRTLVRGQGAQGFR